jgi:hypothetical protein
LLRPCALNTMVRALHVARAWVKVLDNEPLGQIRAPFEETLLRGFQQGGYLGIAQQLMCEFDRFAHVCTECVNVAMSISRWTSGVSLVGCGARPIQGPGCGKVGAVLVT